MPDSYVVALFKVKGRRARDVVALGGNPLQRLESFVKATYSGNLNVTGGFTMVDDTGTQPQGQVTVDAANVSPGDWLMFDFLGGQKTLTVGKEIRPSGNSDMLANNLASAIEQYVPQVEVASVVGAVVTVEGSFPGELLEATVMTTNVPTGFVIVQIGVGVAGVDGAAENYFVGRVHNEVGGGGV